MAIPKHRVVYVNEAGQLNSIIHTNVAGITSFQFPEKALIVGLFQDFGWGMLQQFPTQLSYWETLSATRVISLERFIAIAPNEAWRKEHTTFTMGWNPDETQ